jgi:hypothetical protein
MVNAPAAQKEGEGAHTSGGALHVPPNPHLTLNAPYSGEKPGAHASLQAPPKGAPLAHEAAVAFATITLVPALPLNSGGHHTRYFARSDGVRAARPASDRALSGGAPPRKLSASKIWPRQQ